MGGASAPAPAGPPARQPALGVPGRSRDDGKRVGSGCPSVQVEQRPECDLGLGAGRRQGRLPSGLGHNQVRLCFERGRRGLTARFGAVELGGTGCTQTPCPKALASVEAGGTGITWVQGISVEKHSAARTPRLCRGQCRVPISYSWGSSLPVDLVPRGALCSGRLRWERPEVRPLCSPFVYLPCLRQNCTPSGLGWGAAGVRVGTACAWAVWSEGAGSLVSLSLEVGHLASPGLRDVRGSSPCAALEAFPVFPRPRGPRALELAGVGGALQYSLGCVSFPSQHPRPTLA